VILVKNSSCSSVKESFARLLFDGMTTPPFLRGIYKAGMTFGLAGFLSDWLLTASQKP